MKHLRMRLQFVKCLKSFFHMPLNNAPETESCRNEHAPCSAAREPLTQRDLDYKKWMEDVLSQDPASSLYRNPDETDGMEMLPGRPRDGAGPQNDHYRKKAARRWYRARQPDDQSADKTRAITRRRKRRQHGEKKYFPVGGAVYGSTVAHVAYGINTTQRDFRLQMNNAIPALNAIQLLSPAEMDVLIDAPDAHKMMILGYFVHVNTGGMKRVLKGREE